MSSTPENEARQIEDAAWNVKDAAADLIGRPVSDSDRAVLASVLRDLARLHKRLAEVRDKRVRRKSASSCTDAAETAETTPEPEQDPE